LCDISHTIKRQKVDQNDASDDLKNDVENLAQLYTNRLLPDSNQLPAELSMNGQPNSGFATKHAETNQPRNESHIECFVSNALLKKIYCNKKTRAN